MRQHVLAAIFVFVAAISVTAQQAQKPESTQAAQAATASAAPTIPVRVQLVISKYKAEKKVTSLPYTISTALGRNARLRIGADAPYSATRSGAKPSPDGQPASPPVSYMYRTVGTAIDCTPIASGDGRFRVDLTISHDAISYSGDATPSPQGAPVFPTFSATNTLVLKDGETGQLTVASDPLTGDVIRVDVTLTLVK